MDIRSSDGLPRAKREAVATTALLKPSWKGCPVEDQQAKANRSDGLLNLNELAAYLSCSRTYAYKLVSDSTIPSFKIGTLRRVRREDVVAYVERQLAASEG